MQYIIHGNVTLNLEYTVDADSPEEAKEMFDQCVNEHDSDIIADVQNYANVYVEEE